MARTRRTRPELTESWVDAEDDYFNTNRDEGLDELEEEEEDEEEDHLELRTRRRDGRINHTTDYRDNPRTRSTRAAAEPALVMPRSPNAAAANGNRSKTPRIRLNERSLTSDAGHVDLGKRARDQTPRVRMLDRSMTSDAGKFVRRRSTRQDTILEDEDDDLDGRGTRKTPDHASWLWKRIAAPILAYFTEIVALALHYAKPIIAYGLFAYLLIAGLIFGSNFLTTTLSNALTPVCRIPGVTFFFNPSFCPKYDVPEIAGPAEFDKLVQAQSAFEDILSASAYGVDLPLAMKRSEAGIRDLKNVVEYSQLPSKNELVFEFVGFIDTARQASQDLSRFNSRIGHAVDRILSTNRWTLNVIDGLAQSQVDAGSISRFISDNFNIFAPFQPIALSRDLVLDQYLKHTSAVEEQIQSLISEAQALLAILDNLDGRLDSIFSIAKRDNVKVDEDRDKLLASLWTKLGGNRRDLGQKTAQIELLSNVKQYQRIAWAQVNTAVIKLLAIRADLEGLRERVAMPEIIGDKVPLEVHIDAINLGIERLEQQRESSRKLESESYNRVLSRAAAGNGRMIGDKEL